MGRYSYCCVKTVSEPHLLRGPGLLSSEEQIPQIVESNKNRIEIWETKEAYYSLHTQEVRGSDPENA